jgi:hypothetical protein
VTCISCMDTAMAMHVLLLTNTKGVFPTGCLPSVAVQSEREVVPQINT